MENESPISNIGRESSGARGLGSGLPRSQTEPGQPRPRASRPSGKTLAHGTRTPVPRSRSRTALPGEAGRTSPRPEPAPLNLSPPIPPPCSRGVWPRGWGRNDPAVRTVPLKPSQLPHKGMQALGRESGAREEHRGYRARGGSEMKLRAGERGSGGRHKGARKVWPGAKAWLLGEMWFVAPASLSSAGLSPPLGLRPVGGSGVHSY